MRFRAVPNDKHSQAQQIGGTYDRVIFNRGLLLSLHIALGLAAALMYLSTIGAILVRWYPGRGWVGLGILRCSASLIPYAVSAAYSRRRNTEKRFGLWLFMIVLAGGTSVIGYYYLTRQEATAWGTFAAVLLQTVVYLLAARFLLDSKFDT